MSRTNSFKSDDLSLYSEDSTSSPPAIKSGGEEQAKKPRRSKSTAAASAAPPTDSASSARSDFPPIDTSAVPTSADITSTVTRGIAEILQKYVAGADPLLADALFQRMDWWYQELLLYVSQFSEWHKKAQDSREHAIFQHIFLTMEYSTRAWKHARGDHSDGQWSTDVVSALVGGGVPERRMEYLKALLEDPYAKVVPAVALRIHAFWSNHAPSAVEEIWIRAALLYFGTSIKAMQLGFSRHGVFVYSSKQVKDTYYRHIDEPSEKKLVSLLRKLVNVSSERFFVHAVEPSTLDALHLKFPNFREVTEYIKRQLRLLHLQDKPRLQLLPVLLLGSPGLGKTRYLNALAELLHVPIHELSMSSMTASFIVSGSDTTWEGGKIGRIAKVLTEDFCANPLFILDELDKSQGSQRYDVYGPFYQLLERHTAQRFVDEALQIPLNASHISWFATANSLESIPEPIRNRFHVFTIPDLAAEHIPLVARSVFEDIRAQYPWGSRFSPELSDAVLAKCRGLDARGIHFILQQACGYAASRGQVLDPNEPIVLQPEDLVRAAGRQGIGFLSK